MKKTWLNEKTIIITGASSGIGRELARRLIERNGCHIIGIGRNEDKMQKFKSELGEKGVNFEFKLFDVSVEENWKHFAE